MQGTDFFWRKGLIGTRISSYFYKLDFFDAEVTAYITALAPLLWSVKANLRSVQAFFMFSYLGIKPWVKANLRSVQAFFMFPYQGIKPRLPPKSRGHVPFSLWPWIIDISSQWRIQGQGRVRSFYLFFKSPGLFWRQLAENGATNISPDVPKRPKRTAFDFFKTGTRLLWSQDHSLSTQKREQVDSCYLTKKT